MPISLQFKKVPRQWTSSMSGSSGWLYPNATRNSVLGSRASTRASSLRQSPPGNPPQSQMLELRRFLEEQNVSVVARHARNLRAQNRRFRCGMAGKAWRTRAVAGLIRSARGCPRCGIWRGHVPSPSRTDPGSSNACRSSSRALESSFRACSVNRPGCHPGHARGVKP